MQARWWSARSGAFQGLGARVSIGAIFLALAASPAMSSSPDKADKKDKTVVFAKPVSWVSLDEVIAFPARIVPKANAVLLSESDGVVSKVFAPLGQSVKKGQKILAITHTDPVYQYAPVTVVAPISGVVSSISVVEGTQVSKGDKVAAVTDPSQLKIEVEVPAVDLRHLKKGLKGELKVPGRDDAIAVQVRGVSPFVDPASGTAPGEFELSRQGASRDLSLVPGLIGRIVVRVNSRKGMQVPEYAILYKDREPYVRVVENGKVRVSTLKVGQKQEGMVEVLAGLKDKDLVIERSSRHVSSGEEVEVQTVKN